jgi:hypothetical protein
MGVGVAGQQQQLVDQHRAVPHRRGAADPRQRHAGHHRLGQEQQERPHHDGDEEQGLGKPLVALARPTSLLWFTASPRSISLRTLRLSLSKPASFQAEEKGPSFEQAEDQREGVFMLQQPRRDGRVVGQDS